MKNSFKPVLLVLPDHFYTFVGGVTGVNRNWDIIVQSPFYLAAKSIVLLIFERNIPEKIEANLPYSHESSSKKIFFGYLKFFLIVFLHGAEVQTHHAETGSGKFIFKAEHAFMGGRSDSRHLRPAYTCLL